MSHCTETTCANYPDIPGNCNHCRHNRHLPDNYKLDKRIGCRTCVNEHLMAYSDGPCRYCRFSKPTRLMTPNVSPVS